MNHQQMFKPILTLGVVLVGLLLVGVPVGGLVLPLVVLACPLMMFFMMRGMDHGHRQPDDQPDDEHAHTSPELREDSSEDR